MESKAYLIKEFISRVDGEVLSEKLKNGQFDYITELFMKIMDLKKDDILVRKLSNNGIDLLKVRSIKYTGIDENSTEMQDLLNIIQADPKLKLKKSIKPFATVYINNTEIEVSSLTVRTICTLHTKIESCPLEKIKLGDMLDRRGHYKDKRMSTENFDILKANYDLFYGSMLEGIDEFMSTNK